MSDLLQKLKNTIKKHKLISKKDKLLLAVSGGPDSICMLQHILKIHPNKKIVVAYVNHSLRKASIKDEEFVRNAARNFCLKFISRKINTKKYALEKKITVEEAARILRYSTLSKIAKKLRCNKILTAHNLDDNVETIFFNILRGTGLKGLAGIPYKRKSGKITIVRPMLDIAKKEIMEYLKVNKIKYVVDRTNIASNYTRNFIRNRIFPLIRKKFHAFENNINRLKDIIGDFLIFLKNIIKEAYKKNVTEGRNKISLNLKNRYPRLIYSELILTLLKKIGRKETSYTKLVNDILNLCDKRKTVAIDLPNNWIAKKNNSSIIFEKKITSIQKNIIPYKKINMDGETILKKLKLKINCESRKNIPKKLKLKNTIFIDKSKLNGELYIRSWRSGDYFYPLNLQGRKKIHDLFIDMKIPPNMRDKIPIVCCLNKIVCVLTNLFDNGYPKIDDRFKITSSTKDVLKIKIQKIN